MADMLTLTKSISSISNAYKEIDIKPFDQIGSLQKKMHLFFEQGGLLQFQRQGENLLDVNGITELQKQMQFMLKTFTQIKIQNISPNAIHLQKELIDNVSIPRELTMSPASRDFSIAGEPQKEEKTNTTINQKSFIIDTTLNSSENDESTIIPISIGKWFTVSLLQKILQDDFVAGETSVSEKYINNVADDYGWTSVMNWLNTIYLEYYTNSDVLIGLMHCLSHFDYKNVSPAGPTMALGVLQHKDIYVRDYAIRAFENWNSRQAIPILESLQCESEWQQQYINDVLLVLRTDGDW